MGMKQCPVCGERYSDTYRDCPFCEEEAELRSGTSPSLKKRGGKRANSSDLSILSPILVTLLVILACVLVYLLAGDAIAEKFRGAPAQSPNTSQDAVLPDVSRPEGGASSDGGITMPEVGEPEPSEPEPTVDPSALPEILKVNNADFTLKAGESYTVKVTSGGTGPYTWISDDDGVASVDDGGRVTAISKGRATLTVFDEKGKGTFVVYVKGEAAAPSGGTESGAEPPASSGGAAALNLTDFTTHVGDPDVKLRVSGVTAAITWSTANADVATVSQDGAVHAAGTGTTTVTASYGGQTLKCTVRVPR